jgi:hypothetical protein
VDEALNKYRYVDYSLLSRSPRVKATGDDETLSCSDGLIELKSRAMHPEDEAKMAQFEWLAAAETVEKNILEYHG